MKVSIKMTTTKGELRQMVVGQIADMRQKAIRILNRAGELAVNEARTAGDWKDQTGNLRSSIGYVVCEDGRPVYQSEFAKVRDTAEEGPQMGLDLALRVAGETSGLALVVVAGMDYAVYVADKGYNVLSSSQILAERIVPELFEKQARYDENR